MGCKENIIFAKLFLQAPPDSVSYHLRMSDPDLSSKLRRLIAESGKSVKTISEESGVGYLKMVRWYNGRTRILDIRMAEKMMKHLTGEGLV